MTYGRLRAIALDFDGTILDSNAFKAECFGELFCSLGPNAVEVAKAYHFDNLSQPRAEKIAAIALRLSLALTERELNVHVGRFSERVSEGILGCSFVPGFESFLDVARGRWPLFVSSATPQEELEYVINSVGLGGEFDAVFGFPTSKETSLATIASRICCDAEQILMVGDSVSDQSAADRAGAMFHLVGEDSPTGYASLVTLMKAEA